MCVCTCVCLCECLSACVWKMEIHGERGGERRQWLLLNMTRHSGDTWEDCCSLTPLIRVLSVLSVLVFALPTKLSMPMTLFLLPPID